MLVLHAAGVRQIALVVGAASIATDHVDRGAAQFAQIHIHLDEDLCAHAFAFANQAEQNVFGADVAVPQLQRLAQRKLQHLLGVRSKWDVPIRSGVAFADHFLDLLAGIFEGHALGFQSLGRYAFSLTNQAEQQMLRADVIVLEGTSLFLRQHDHAPRTVGKPFEHASPSMVGNSTSLYRFTVTFISVPPVFLKNRYVMLERGVSHGNVRSMP